MPLNMNPVTLPRVYAGWEPGLAHIARRTLRSELREIDVRDLRYDDSLADALIESVWNAIVKASGHDAQSTRSISNDPSRCQMPRNEPS